MRVVFFGTGRFGIPVLKSLLRSSHNTLAVVTRPDARKGRGWNVTPTPVKDIVEKTAPETAVLQPVKLADKSFIEDLRSFNADIFVVVDYGRILPREVLEIPGKYCLNLHPSLLPLYRGPAPVNRAILEGDSVTGNTVIRMNERMDSGDIILQDRTDIGEHDTSDVLSEKLSVKGAVLLLKAVDLIASGKEEFTAQDESKATYAAKLERPEGRIEWTLPADEICLKVRGLRPWPGTYTYLGGKVLKIIQAAACDGPDGEFTPGQVLVSETKLIVKTGRGALRVGKLQLEGKKAMTSDEFLLGHKDLAGTVLGQ
ncbi:MAG: methionyl-tRNA formyltransferase [Candidatus Omnitrophota bacterium]